MKAKTEACVSFFLISFGFVASFAQAPAQPPQQPEFVKLRSAVDAGWKGGRGVGTLSPDCPDFAEFGSCQRRGWERTRPDGERRGGTEVFHQGNRCCGHARGQGISQESDGNVIRVRGELQENHRVRTTGVRLPRQREELLSAGRDCERGGTRLYRFRRFGHCVQVVPDWPRHGTEGTRHQACSARPVELPVGARAGSHRRPARRPNRSTKACCCGKSDPRQGDNSRTSSLLPLPEGLCRVLCRRLQDRTCRTEQSKPERSVYPVHDRANLRKAGGEGQSCRIDWITRLVGSGRGRWDFLGPPPCWTDPT